MEGKGKKEGTEAPPKAVSTVPDLYVLRPDTADTLKARLSDAVDTAFGTSTRVGDPQVTLVFPYSCQVSFTYHGSFWYSELTKFRKLVRNTVVKAESWHDDGPPKFYRLRADTNRLHISGASYGYTKVSAWIEFDEYEPKEGEGF